MHAAVEEQADRKRAGGEGEHETTHLGGGDAAADRVGDDALEDRRSAGPEDAAARVGDGERGGGPADRGAQGESDVTEDEQREGPGDAASQTLVVVADEAEGGERTKEAAHAARGPEDGDPGAVSAIEHFLAEEREEDEDAAEGEAEARLDREQRADAAVAGDVADAFAQVFHA